MSTQVVELARAAGLGEVALGSRRVAANASPNRLETLEGLRAARAKTKIRRQIRRWQQARNAEDPNITPGLELRPEERATLEAQLAEIPRRLQSLKKAELKRRSLTDPGSRFLRQPP